MVLNHKMDPYRALLVFMKQFLGFFMFFILNCLKKISDVNVIVNSVFSYWESIKAFSIMEVMKI